MRCDTCHGSGKIPARKVSASEPEDRGPAELPCPDCDGCGIAHCCDGICEQPDQ